VEKIILQVYLIIVQEKDQHHRQGKNNCIGFFFIRWFFRPSAIRNLNSPGGADWNQSEEGIFIEYLFFLIDFY
jgi:hypothetical protein